MANHRYARSENKMEMGVVPVLRKCVVFNERNEHINTIQIHKSLVEFLRTSLSRIINLLRNRAGSQS